MLISQYTINIMIFGFGKKSAAFEYKKNKVEERQKKQKENLKAHTDPETGKLMSKTEKKAKTEARIQAETDKKSSPESVASPEAEQEQEKTQKIEITDPVTDQEKERDLRNAADALHQGLTEEQQKPTEKKKRTKREQGKDDRTTEERVAA